MQPGRVRLYCPYGEMVPGMGYLVRRLLENTANESFLRLSFELETDSEQLLEDPAAAQQRFPPLDSSAGQAANAGAVAFHNEPAADFTRPELRAAFPAAIAVARNRAGLTVPLFINGRDVTTADTIPSRNPNRPEEILGQVCQAGLDEVDNAVAAARAAFPVWRATPAAGTGRLSAASRRKRPPQYCRAGRLAGAGDR